MRVIKDFNNISPELKAKIQPLKHGQRADYQIKEFTIVTDPETNVKQIFYTKREIYLKDTIWDSFAERSVDIGIPSLIEKDEVKSCKLFQFDNPFDGTVYLYGDKIEDREAHEILQLMNMCGNSILGEDRNTNVPVVFNLVDRAKEARTSKLKRNKKKEALVFLDDMSTQDMREFAASMNWNYNLDAEVLSNMVGEYAENFTEYFHKAMVSVDTKRKATIKYALEEGTITYDPSGNRIMWGNGSGVLASLERVEGKNHIDVFNDWLASVANGDKILGQLKKKAKAETA